MFSLLEVKNYRCLRYVRQPLGRFQVLVGPNASGKSTFLDVFAFLRSFLADGIDAAVEERTYDFRDLVWQRHDEPLEIALEAPIPDEFRNRLDDPRYDTVRYEVAWEFRSETNQTQIVEERAWLMTAARDDTSPQRWLFPEATPPPRSVIHSRAERNMRRLFSKNAQGTDSFQSEVHPKQGRWTPAFRLGPRKSTLANLPEDESAFPVSTWLKSTLSAGIEALQLHSVRMRFAAPPGRGTTFDPAGSNLPWVLDDLRRRHPDRFAQWMAHVQTALPDIVDIDTVERPEDRHRYLRVRYASGLEVPSWSVSDGTLRMLALTLLAYIAPASRVYLIEEPENGIHPRALESVIESLSSIYEAQVLVTTHSPVVLSVVDPQDVLCFARQSGGATAVVRGDHHPKLRDWHRDPDLGTLFAAGVLS